MPPVGWESEGEVDSFSAESDYNYCTTTFTTQKQAHWRERCLANSLTEDERKTLADLADQLGDEDLSEDDALGRRLRFKIAEEYGVGSIEEWSIAIINNISQDQNLMSPEARLDMLQKIQYLSTQGQDGMDAIIEIAKIASLSRANDGDMNLTSGKLLWATTIFATASITEQYQMDEFMPPEFAQFGPMDEDLLALLEAGTWIVDGSGLVLDLSDIGITATNKMIGIPDVKGITAFQYAGVVFLIVNGSIDMVTSVSKYDNPDDKWMAVAHSSGRIATASLVAAGGTGVALACGASVVCGVVVVAGATAVGYGADWWVRQDSINIFGTELWAPGQSY